MSSLKDGFKNKESISLKDLVFWGFLKRVPTGRAFFVSGRSIPSLNGLIVRRSDGDIGKGTL